MVAVQKAAANPESGAPWHKDHGDCCPGATAFVRVSGLEQFHQEITSTGYSYMRPGIEVAPWNAKLMEVTDPFGNRLRFNEDIA
ncbi:MAG: glyoxalase superfamily protein [Burkholderiales bacterium]